MNTVFQKTPQVRLQKIESDLLLERKVELYMLRLDEIDSMISGNKWFKLKYNILNAIEKGVKTVLTFGGAYSNHLLATARACRLHDLDSIGIVRGEELSAENPTLRSAVDCGMQLKFVSRSNYRNKETVVFRQELKNEFGEFYQIPEGGTNQLALKGAAEIMDLINFDSYTLVSAVGTGGTLAGMILGGSKKVDVLGISALKGDFLQEEIKSLLAGYNSRKFQCKWELINEYHFGGYAKFDSKLIDFINDFSRTYSIALDPIYTGKLMFGIFDLLKKGYFETNSKVIAVHSGGLQGVRGFNERFGNLIETNGV